LVPLGNPQEMQYTDDVGLDAGFYGLSQLP
jgi:hypothetical protein